jgi:glutaredoxin
MSTRRPAPPRTRTARPWRAAATLLALATLAAPALALYKVVGPDGRVTYTDRPPADASARITPMQGGTVNEVPATGPDTLPQDLRRVATRYPVTLYGAADCAPCEASRKLLQERGIPFTEKLVVTEDDAAAMERVIGARTVPALTIGAQALRGLSPPEWNAYLDAAGYPRESRLPKNWQPPPAAPLVARQPVRPVAPAPLVAPLPARRASAPLDVPSPLAVPEPGAIRF